MANFWQTRNAQGARVRSAGFSRESSSGLIQLPNSELAILMKLTPKVGDGLIEGICQLKNPSKEWNQGSNLSKISGVIPLKRKALGVLDKGIFAIHVLFNVVVASRR